MFRISLILNVDSRLKCYKNIPARLCRWIFCALFCEAIDMTTMLGLQDYITFLGESAESTVLTYNRKACDKKADGSEYTILDCPTVIVDASNFIAKGITFENSSPKPDDFDYNSQAPAIRVSGDNCAFYDCAFLGWQDTLYADQGKHYYKDSRIEGNVDFILGYASAVFDNCTIYSRGMITLNQLNSQT